MYLFNKLFSCLYTLYIDYMLQFIAWGSPQGGGGRQEAMAPSPRNYSEEPVMHLGPPDFS